MKIPPPPLTRGFNCKIAPHAFPLHTWSHVYVLCLWVCGDVRKCYWPVEAALFFFFFAFLPLSLLLSAFFYSISLPLSRKIFFFHILQIHSYCGEGVLHSLAPGCFRYKTAIFAAWFGGGVFQKQKKKERESDRDKKQVMKQTKGSRTSPHHHQQQTNTKQKKEGKNKVYTDPRDNASILLSHSLILTRLLPPLFLMCSRC